MGECLIIRTGGGVDTSDANATPATIVAGYTVYVNDAKIIGEMTNNGAIEKGLVPGESYTIPTGWHNGDGRVTVASLASQTVATASDGDIVDGYTGWKDGGIVTGSMPNNGAISQSLGINSSYAIPAGWHNGSGTVKQSIATQGATTITPGTANKTAVAAGRYCSGNITIVGSSALTAANIRKGIKIFGVTGTWEGWVDPNVYIIKNGAAQVPLTFYWRWFWDSSKNGGEYAILGEGTSVSTSGGAYYLNVPFAFCYSSSSSSVLRDWIGYFEVMYAIPGINTGRTKYVYGDIKYNADNIANGGSIATDEWFGISMESWFAYDRTYNGSTTTYYSNLKGTDTPYGLTSNSASVKTKSATGAGNTFKIPNDTTKYTYKFNTSGRGTTRIQSNLYSSHTSGIKVWGLGMYLYNLWIKTK